MMRASMVLRVRINCFAISAIFVAAPLFASDFASLSVEKSAYRGTSDVVSDTAAAKKIYKNKVKVKGQFALGAGSNGIDFSSDTIRISFGDFTQTIGPAELTAASSGVKYKSKDLNRLRTLKIVRKGSAYDFAVKGTHLLLDRPELFTIQVGDDVGQVTLSTG